jgi:hypothetical protein
MKGTTTDRTSRIFRIPNKFIKNQPVMMEQEELDELDRIYYDVLQPQEAILSTSINKLQHDEHCLVDALRHMTTDRTTQWRDQKAQTAQAAETRLRAALLQGLDDDDSDSDDDNDGNEEQDKKQHVPDDHHQHDAATLSSSSSTNNSAFDRLKNALLTMHDEEGKDDENDNDDSSSSSSFSTELEIMI